MKKRIVIFSVVLIAVFVSVLLVINLSLSRNYQSYSIIDPKVTSSQSVDMSSLESTIDSLISPQMSHEQKAITIWRFLIDHTYLSIYPTENTKGSWYTMNADPIKALNIYPWGECGWYSIMLQELFTAAGMPTRGRSVGPKPYPLSHWVPEVYYDGAWHMLDAEVGVYYYKRDGKTIASVDDLISDPSLILEPIRTSSPYLRVGRSVQEVTEVYGVASKPTRKAFKHEGGYHSMNITLRPGEKYIRRWGKEGGIGYLGYWYWPKGVSEEYRAKTRQPYGLLPEIGPTSFKGTGIGFSKVPGSFANGKLVYEPNMDGDGYLDGVYEKTDVKSFSEDHLTPSIHLDDARKPGHITFSVECPYIIVAGRIRWRSFGKNPESHVKASISVDNGKTWQEVWTDDKIGENIHDLHITSYIYGVYSYLVKFDLWSKNKKTDVGMDSLQITTVFQLAPTSLPKLGRGENEITVTLANPEVLQKSRFVVIYNWDEKDRSTGKMVNYRDEKIITKSPTKYKIIIQEGQDPVNRYVEMSVLGKEVM